MIRRDFEKKRKCAFSNDEHIYIKPVPLKCGHFVCLNCIPSENKEVIECKICELVRKEALHSFDDIFQILEKETTERLNVLKGTYQNE